MQAGVFRKRSPYALEPLSIGQFLRTGLLSTREPVILRKHTILLERLLRKHSHTPGRTATEALSPEPLSCKVKNIVFGETAMRSPARKAWNLQAKKRKGLSVGGRISLKRLEVSHYKSLPRPKHRLAGSDESKVAVVNLTYHSMPQERLPGRFQPRSRTNTRKSAQGDPASEQTISPARKLADLTDISELPVLLPQRSSSLTPSQWNLATASLSTKPLRRTIYTHQSGDMSAEVE